MTESSTSTFFYRLSIVQIILIGFSLRLFCAILVWDNYNYDIESYYLVGNYVLTGKDVYSMEDTLKRHPYLPLQMYWLGGARLISEALQLPFPFVVKWPFIAADTGIVLAIYRKLLTENNQNSIRGAFLYAINPISVYVSAFHGQFDSVPTLFSLISLMALEKSSKRSGFWLGLGIWVKSFPVLVLPTVLIKLRKNLDRFWFLFICFLLPLLGVVFYIQLYNSSIKVVLFRAITYNHGIGVWGYTYLLRILAIWKTTFAPILLNYFKISRFVTLTVLALIWWLYLRRDSNPFRLYFITLLSFLGITHAFSIQYLMWVIPFAVVIDEGRWLLRYVMASFAYMFLVYNTLIMKNTITNLLPWPQADLWIIIPSSFPVWLICLTWLLRLLTIRENGKA